MSTGWEEVLGGNKPPAQGPGPGQQQQQMNGDDNGGGNVVVVPPNVTMQQQQQQQRTMQQQQQMVAHHLLTQVRDGGEEAFAGIGRENPNTDEWHDLTLGFTLFSKLYRATRTKWVRWAAWATRAPTCRQAAIPRCSRVWRIAWAPAADRWATQWSCRSRATATSSSSR